MIRFVENLADVKGMFPRLNLSPNLRTNVYTQKLNPRSISAELVYLAQFQALLFFSIK